MLHHDKHFIKNIWEYSNGNTAIFFIVFLE